MSVRVRWQNAGLVIALLYSAACADESKPVEASASLDDRTTASSIASEPPATAPSAGGGVDGPVAYWAANDGLQWEEAIIEGAVQHEGDCLFIQSSEEPANRSTVLWQFGTTWRASDSVIVLPSGEIVRPGDTVRGPGGFKAADRLDFFTTDREAVDRLTSCALETTGSVAVIQGPGVEVETQTGIESSPS